jgi:hypothetical protein
MDFIGHPKTYNEAMKKYNSLIAKGWVPMDREDLEKVSGCGKDIVEDTITTPGVAHKSRWPVFIGVFLFTSFILWSFNLL